VKTEEDTEEALSIANAKLLLLQEKTESLDRLFVSILKMANNDLSEHRDRAKPTPGHLQSFSSKV